MLAFTTSYVGVNKTLTGIYKVLPGISSSCAKPPIEGLRLEGCCPGHPLQTEKWERKRKKLPKRKKTHKQTNNKSKHKWVRSSF